MDILFERIKTQIDLEQIKYWLEDIDLLRMARMREAPLSDLDLQDYLSTLSFLVFVDGLAIGYARIYPSESSREGEIGIVIADPEYRGKGIGTEIGKKLIATCMVMGMTTLDWATGDFNIPSIKLAKKLGFKFYKLIPEVLTILGDKHDALVYRLEVKK